MLKNTTLVALSLVTVEIQFNFCDKTNNGKLWCCPLYPRYDNALWILCCSVESLISFITTAASEVCCGYPMTSRVLSRPDHVRDMPVRLIDEDNKYAGRE